MNKKHDLQKTKTDLPCANPLTNLFQNSNISLGWQSSAIALLKAGTADNEVKTKLTALTSTLK